MHKPNMLYSFYLLLGAFKITDMELTPIEFIAQMINDQKARAEGYAASTRWGTLREDLKAEYKAEAERMFEQWKADEIEAENSRNKMMEGITIKSYDE